MHLRSILVRLFLVAALPVGCSDTPTPPGPTPTPPPAPPAPSATRPDSPPPDDAVEALAGGADLFAVAIYKRLARKPGNVFISPCSIWSAMTMTSAGAAGQTLAQMEQVLGLGPVSGEQRHEAVGALAQQLRPSASGDEPPFQLQIANALWVQRELTLQPTFEDLLGRHYTATAQQVDFVRDTEGARLRINDWVAWRTGDRIQDLFPAGILNGNTRLVLTNAVYFLGTWRHQFRPDRTQVGDFRVTPERTVQVPLMSQENRFGYALTEFGQIVELPYRGGSMAMVILLPADAEAMARLETSLDPQRLLGWVGELREHQVTLTMPRFTITAEYELNEPLVALGMADAFTPRADLTGMVDEPGLFIQTVRHKAFVSVDERGTEAAAATGVAIGRTSVPPQATFRADRPFLLLIRDRASGVVLFMGRVNDPTV